MSKKPPSTTSNDEIDENLRRVYKKVLEEEVPDRFRDLLERLKTESSSKSEGK